MSGPSLRAQGCSSSTCGNAVLTLTDAPGDFASYTVGVTSIQLTKADGTVVDTLPAATTVDSAQLVDVTELVGSAAIPQGEYVAATMTLDYSNASIFVYTDDADTQTPPGRAGRHAGDGLHRQSADDDHAAAVAGKVEQVLAVGKSDATSNTLTAEQMVVNLD